MAQVKKNGLTLKIFLLIILNDIFNTIAQFILKKALIQTGIVSINPGNIAEFAARNISSPLIWLGLSIYALNFFVWIVVLYKVDLSIAMPVGSTSYIFVPIVAIIFLHEHVSPVRWLAILCIILGINFVAQSSKAQKEGPGS